MTGAAGKARTKPTTFQAKILAPRYAPKDKAVFKEFNVAAVVIKRDWKIATKLAMVEDANNLITKAYMTDSLDAAFPLILTSVIEEKGLYEYSIGEFFLLLTLQMGLALGRSWVLTVERCGV